MTYWENFTHNIAGQRPDMLYAGPDTHNRPTIEQLITDIGPRPQWLGQGTTAADILDGLLRAWYALAQHNHTKQLAFQILTQQAQH